MLYHGYLWQGRTACQSTAAQKLWQSSPIQIILRKEVTKPLISWTATMKMDLIPSPGLPAVRHLVTAKRKKSINLPAKMELFHRQAKDKFCRGVAAPLGASLPLLVWPSKHLSLHPVAWWHSTNCAANSILPCLLYLAYYPILAATPANSSRATPRHASSTGCTWQMKFTRQSRTTATSPEIEQTWRGNAT